jgi:large subunit ribosomal protein L29
MKIKELRELTVEELHNRCRELKLETVHLRMQQQSGQLENPARLNHLRREVARMRTLINERAQKTA